MQYNIISKPSLSLLAYPMLQTKPVVVTPSWTLIIRLDLDKQPKFLAANAMV